MAVGSRRYDKPVHFNLKAGFEISSNKRQWDKQDHCTGTTHRVGSENPPPTCRALTPRWKQPIWTVSGGPLAQKGSSKKHRCSSSPICVEIHLPYEEASPSSILFVTVQVATKAPRHKG